MAPATRLNPFVLARGAGLEPWRLWTCHAVHFGPRHALVNLAALAAPFVLVPPQVRPRMVLALALLAPVLGLAILAVLDHGQYRGASGLACAAWSMAGFHLLRTGTARMEGGLILALLALKLIAEAMTGHGLMPPAGDWESLPAAHQWGTLLGALFSPLLRQGLAE